MVAALVLPALTSLQASAMVVAPQLHPQRAATAALRQPHWPPAGATPCRGTLCPRLLQRATATPRSPVPALTLHATAPVLRSRALHQSLSPILTVVLLCILGMIPTGLRSLAPGESNKKLWRRVFTGCLLGVVVTMWIFSGTYAFLSAFVMMAVVAQNEYYYMARQNGCYPTWKLGTLGSLAMYVAACSPQTLLRDAMFPLTGVVTIVYLLLRRERKTPPTTMNDISTTFMGIYYFGYMPSFWIRLRCLCPVEPQAILALFTTTEWRTSWPLAAIARSGADIFTHGAIIQWWTMVSIVAADVAAYFAGKRFGKTPLIKVVSPNKTWEGLVGGCVASLLVSTTGALLMRWPVPLVSGALYGLVIAVVALIGDLTVSILKRSANVKDTGKLLPGHGGLLDRLDSYLLVSAPAYFFVILLLRCVPPL